MLTLEELKAMPSGKIFAEGVIENSPDGLYMTDTQQGRELLWLAKKGFGGTDWCIYCHWADMGRNFVITNGDKVTDKKNIQKLVPCDEEAFKQYRR